MAEKEYTLEEINQEDREFSLDEIQGNKKPLRESSESSIAGQDLLKGAAAIGGAGIKVLTWPLDVAATTAVSLNPFIIGLQKLAGKEVTKPSDIIRAIKGDAPTGEEYLQRAGWDGPSKRLSDVVPNLYTESNDFLRLKPAKGGLLDPTARGAVGAAIDIGKGFGGAKVTQALSEAGGRAAHAYAYKEADALAKRFNQSARPSDVAWKYKIEGTPEQIGNKAAKSIEDINSKVKLIQEEASDLGAKVDIPKAFSSVERKIETAVSGKNEIKANIAERLKGFLDRIKQRAIEKPEIPQTTQINQVPSQLVDEYGKPYITTQTRTIPGVPAERAPTLSEMSDIKSDLYKEIGSSEYETLRKSPYGKMLLKDAARGIKSGIEDAAESAIPGAGKEIAQLNAEQGALLTAGKMFKNDIMKQARKHGFTEVDLMALGYNPKIWAAKQLGKIPKSKFILTKGGRSAFNFGGKYGRVAPELSIVESIKNYNPSLYSSMLEENE